VDARQTQSTAAVHGPRWGARAEDWAELAAPLSLPAWRAVADATGIVPGTRVLDIGCGSGEFLRLAADRGAVVSGLDAAEGMLAVARKRLSDADLRVGAMERLPWADDSFDVVTGFNAFQFAAGVNVALAEAVRVVEPEGQVAIANWGRAEENELQAVMAAVRPLLPPSPPGGAAPSAPAVGEPGVLKGLAHAAGLRVLRVDHVQVPFEAPDLDTLVRALAAPGGSVRTALEVADEGAVRAAIEEASEPYRRADGSYAFANRFTYLVGSRNREW
jgi:SAM-dependent methyltransferase